MAKATTTKTTEQSNLDDDMDQVQEPAQRGNAGRDDEEINDDENTDDDADDIENDDEWSGDETEEWDADFEEFDMPKSKSKNKDADEDEKDNFEDEDDFKVDEEFDDLFGGGKNDGFDEEDDF